MARSVNVRIVRIREPGLSENGSRTLFFYYDLNKRDDISEEEDETGEQRGGQTIWGTLAIIQKTFKLTHEQVMWGDSWINLLIKMKDMPHYHMKTKTGKDKSGKAKPIPGNKDILKSKFSKYQAR